MSKTNPFLIKKLFQNCTAIHNLHLHENHDNVYYFHVQTPESKDPIIGTITGGHEQPSGLSLFSGSDVNELVRHLFFSDEPELPRNTHMFAYEMVPTVRLDHDWKTWYKKNKIDLLRVNMAPVFYIARPGMTPGSMPDDRDVRVLLYVTHGILASVDQGLLELSAGPSDGSFLSISVTGDINDIQTQAEWSSTKCLLEEGQDETDVGIIPFPSETEVISGSHLPVRQHTWILLLANGNSGKNENDESDARVLIFCDEIKGPFFSACIDDLEPDSILSAFHSLFLGEAKGHLMMQGAAIDSMPSLIITNDPAVKEALDGQMASRSINVLVEQESPLLDEMAEKFSEIAVKTALGNDGLLWDLDGPLPSMDAPEEWDWAFIALKEWLLKEAYSQEFDEETRPRKRFTDDNYFEYYTVRFRNHGFLTCYYNWLLFCYRPTKRSRTFAEDMMEKRGSQTVSTLIRYIQDAPVRFHLIESIDIESREVVFMDCLTKKQFTVRDSFVAENAQEGVVMLGKAVIVGNFCFSMMLGPALMLHTVKPALDFLGSKKKLADSGQVYDNPDAMGYLWPWLDNYEPSFPNPPERRGDLQVTYHAIFAAKNMKLVHKLLGRKTELQYEPDDDCYFWVDPEQSLLPEPAIRASFIVEEYEVNLFAETMPCFLKARKWLEGVAGVKMVDAWCDDDWDDEDDDWPDGSDLP